MRRILYIALFSLFALASYGQTAPSYDAVIRKYNPVVDLPLTEASGNLKDSASGVIFTPSGSGTILYQQASTLPGRSSISMTTNGAYFAANNNTVGGWDWNTAWWAVVRVKNTAVTATAPYLRQELFSKGHPSDGNLDTTGAGGPGYDAYLHWNSAMGGGAGVEVCLSLWPSVDHSSGYTACTASSYIYSLTDGTHANTYNIVFSYDGLGTSTSIKIYVEGQDGGERVTYTGTPTVHTMNDASNPLIIGGDIDNAIGSQGTNVRNPNPTLIEAFAMGSGAAPTGLIHSLTSSAPLANQIVAPASNGAAAAMNVIYDNDGRADSDNLSQLEMIIRLHKQRYLNLILANNDSLTDGTTSGQYLFRQMLDQAGMNHIPVSYASGTWSGQVAGDSIAADLAAYSANYASYTFDTDVTAFRKALAAAPDGTVYIVSGGSPTSIARLMQSSADGISPLSGAALFAAKVVGVYAMQSISGSGNWDQDLTSAQYIVANHGSVPLYFFGDNILFSSTGPGVPESRAANDPTGLALTRLGQDVRASWDLWPSICSVFASYWCNNTYSGEGKITFTSTSATSFSTATHDKTYNASTAGTWGGTGYPGPDSNGFVGTVFMNSIVQPRPDPPLLFLR
jgi:hypothetical protein